MNAKKLAITFQDRKAEATCNWLLRQFASKKQFLLPATIEDYIKIHKDRGLGMQYRDKAGHAHFPTESGWNHFLDFARAIQRAEPFQSRSTVNDTSTNFSRAIADMISAGFLPESLDELVGYLPDSFVDDITCRSEISFSKLNGVSVTGDSFIKLGRCWVGTYGSLSFDSILDGNSGQKDVALETLSGTYDRDDAVVVTSQIPGTSARAQEEAIFQSDVALSILAVFLNMTYEDAFHRLWQLRRMDRPEHGLSRHLSFAFYKHTDRTTDHKLSYKTQFAVQPFDIGAESVLRWHNNLGLNILNALLAQPEKSQVDLMGRLVNALLYFRQATQQATPEMQVSVLWVCVESFFTAGNENILEVNVPGLLAMTVSSLHRDYWPKRAESLDELRRVFTQYYKYRSKTFHHGQRGHVTKTDVRDFSIVVSNLIIGVMHLIKGGCETVADLQSELNRFNRT